MKVDPARVIEFDSTQAGRFLDASLQFIRAQDGQHLTINFKNQSDAECLTAVSLNQRTVIFPEKINFRSPSRITAARFQIDSAAAWVRFHNHIIHRDLRPKGEQPATFFDVLEKARCDTLLARDYWGMHVNFAESARLAASQIDKDNEDSLILAATYILARRCFEERDFASPAEKDFVKTQTRKIMRRNIFSPLVDIHDYIMGRMDGFSATMTFVALDQKERVGKSIKEFKSQRTNIFARLDQKFGVSKNLDLEENLSGLIEVLDDQREFAKRVREFVKDIRKLPSQKTSKKKKNDQQEENNDNNEGDPDQTSKSQQQQQQRQEQNEEKTAASKDKNQDEQSDKAQKDNKEEEQKAGGKQKGDNQGDNADTHEAEENLKELMQTAANPMPKSSGNNTYSKKGLMDLDSFKGYRVYPGVQDSIINAERITSPENLARLRREMDKTRERYRSTLAPALARLRSKLSGLRETAWHHDLEEGRLDPTRYVRAIVSANRRDIFKERKAVPEPNTVITLLIDNSNSMKNKIHVAAMLADLIAQNLDSSSIKVEVLGHSTGINHNTYRQWAFIDGSPPNAGRLDDNIFIIYKDAETPYRKARDNFAAALDTSTFCVHNNDGEALIWARNRMMRKYKKQRKIIIALSDGLPEGRYQIDAEPVVQGTHEAQAGLLKQVATAIESGTGSEKIELYAIGIDLPDLTPSGQRKNAKEQKFDIHDFYSNAVTVNKLEDLGPQLIYALADMLDNKMRRPRISAITEIKDQKAQASPEPE